MSEEKPKKKSKMGRPRIPTITPDLGELGKKLPPRPINWEQVKYWMDLGATEAEIAGSFHVSVDTLCNRVKDDFGCTFTELRERTSGVVKVGLRHNQYKLSQKNASMAIWLGKLWLAQRDPDKHQENVNAKDMIDFMNGFMDTTRELAPKRDNESRDK